MVQGFSEIAAMCVGLFGLIGAAATTGMPMWKVTAFIGANIIVMETRWEGLWMNCYRQANIRMQCKVYDSLLFLPADLQAARGLMCCSLALSGLGLLVAMAGMRCISCIRENDRAKTIILQVAGGMQFMACVSVIIPVSWTGHVIIRDFYNPLLIDAERRELGEALYIGWVTSAFLFASGMLFVCRRRPSEKGSFNVYNQANLLRYKPAASRPTLMRYHPISSVPSLPSNAYYPSLQANGYVGQHFETPMQNIPRVMTNDGTLISPPVVYNPGLPDNQSMLYQDSLAHHSSMHSSNHVESLYTPGNSLYMSQNTTPYSLTYMSNPAASYQSSIQPVPHTPVFIGYTSSRRQLQSRSGSGPGVYI
ncbi:claudin-8-like [Pseudochaenichthys georgianus]|uniref:claudin-8-like n=1 Tax=Pseudochaenichthys georgianus TaxID=52239 RepID=UPI00146A602F|nr:claudin-8-like [Pseudochaenichthys georgianus]